MAADHPARCWWFWAWTGAGFGLALSFLAVFSLGPLLLPFVTLLVGVCAARRVAPRTIAIGAAVAFTGVAGGFAAEWMFLATPLVTLAVGVSPAVARTATGIARAAACAVVVTAAAVSVIAIAPMSSSVLVVIPLALVAFALAVSGGLHSDAAGLVAGAGLLGLMFGELPAVLLVAAGGVAFPLFAPRPAAGPGAAG
ncbi:MAG: hypothetical protein ACTHNU_13795 [Gaiellales bacterium]